MEEKGRYNKRKQREHKQASKPGKSKLVNRSRFFARSTPGHSRSSKCKNNRHPRFGNRDSSRDVTGIESAREKDYSATNVSAHRHLNTAHSSSAQNPSIIRGKLA